MRGRIPSTDIGKRRIAAGYTIDQIAGIAEVSPSAVALFERRGGVIGRITPKGLAIKRAYDRILLEQCDDLARWTRQQIDVFLKERERVITIANSNYRQTSVKRTDIYELGDLLIRARRYQLAYGQELNPQRGHKGK